MIAIIRLFLFNFIIGLYDTSKAFVKNVYDRVVHCLQNLLAAVIHVAMIPVHAVLWVWGCLKSTARAIQGIWKK